jgi:hypothetical protein
MEELMGQEPETLHDTGSQEQPEVNDDLSQEPRTSETPEHPKGDGEGQDPRVRKANEEAKRYRLELRETQQMLETLKAEMAGLEAKQQDAYNKRFSEMESKLQAQIESAEKRELEAQRVSALAAKGLSPELADLISATDEDGIAAQVEKLAGLKPTKTSGGRIGHGAPAKTPVIPVLYQDSRKPEDTFRDGGVNWNTSS